MTAGLPSGERELADGLVVSASSPLDLRAEAVDLPPSSMSGAGEWRRALRPYAQPDWRSAWQLCTNLAMLVCGWLLAVKAYDVQPVLAVLPALLISVAVVRCFIVFHDCGHGSFSRSRRLNDIVGSLLGIVVFTPFRYWGYAHALHHATASDLDRRGVGDVWTMTVEEFRSASKRRRAYYRLYHSPWVLLTVGALIKFLVIERIVTRPDTTPTRVKRSVHFTNIGIVVYAAVMCWLVGVPRFLLVQGVALVLGGSGAIWLFYVQHRFEGAYWTRRSDWRFIDAGLRGSSHLRLGPVLRFASGNIGFHHLHHLDAHIPNYNLPRCSRQHPELAAECVLTLRGSLAAARLKLWDERSQRYVGFRAVSS